MPICNRSFFDRYFAAASLICRVPPINGGRSQPKRGPPHVSRLELFFDDKIKFAKFSLATRLTNSSRSTDARLQSVFLLT